MDICTIHSAQHAGGVSPLILIISGAGSGTALQQHRFLIDPQVFPQNTDLWWKQRGGGPKCLAKVTQLSERGGLPTYIRRTPSEPMSTVTMTQPYTGDTD
jgi:hypothetical protein